MLKKRMAKGMGSGLKGLKWCCCVNGKGWEKHHACMTTIFMFLQLQPLEEYKRASVKEK
jgi:hypothetical protein